MPTGITVATSIAPRDIELQRGAIASWRKLGLSVISVNSQQEIELIQESFPEVGFAKAHRNALAVARKPYVYFDDILKVLESTGAPLCGIVNSDIYLRAEEGLLRFISQEADDGFLFGSRIDIASLGSLSGEVFYAGFDYFLFNRKVISTYIQTDFSLGVPWWDYWAALVPMIKGYPVKQLITPFAFHIKHSTRWSGRQLNYYGNKLLDCLAHENVRKHMDDHLVAIVDKKRTAMDVLPHAFDIWVYIIQKSAKIFHPSKESAGIADELAYREDIEKYLIKHVQCLYSSRSWRITAPLRWLHGWTSAQ